MASRGKSKKSAMESLAKQFSAITGASEEVGHRLLEVCNGNLEMAIGMQLEGAVNTADVSASAGPSGASAGPSGALAGSSSADGPPEILPDNSVRAPIPQKRETLVQDVPTFGPRPRQRGGQMSIFDKFRDFQAETRHQEAMIRNQGNQIPQSAKIRTLEDLFRPPVDLMHKGTFNTARDAGQSKGCWLIVNVQDVQEFNCQKLNRDVWSNPTIKSIINESFIFWQVYHDSDEGRRYMQFYRVNEFPHVAILDPRTGELLASWNKLDSVSFCDLVMEFISQHPCFDKDTLSSPPAKRARTTKSILDASEDSQLEAAIAASLAESSSSSSQSTQPTEHSSTSSVLKRTQETISLSDDEEMDDEEDDEENIIVNVESNSSHGSDSDCIIESVADDDNSKNLPDGQTSNCSPLHSSSTRANTTCVERTESVPSSVNGTAGTGDERTKAVDLNDDTENKSDEEEVGIKRKSSDICDEISIEDAGDDETTKTGLKNGRTENDADEQSLAKLMLRFPDGQRKQLSLPEDTPLLTLVKMVSKEGFSNERYEMVTNFPRRKLSYMDFDKTLKEAGLCPQETIFIQER